MCSTLSIDAILNVKPGSFKKLFERPWLSQTFVETSPLIGSNKNGGSKNSDIGNPIKQEDEFE